MEAGWSNTACGGPSLSKLYPAPSKPMRWIPAGSATNSDARGVRGGRHSRVARPGRDVVGIEEISEPPVEDPITGKMRDQEELLEKPGRVRAMPFGRARIRHRLHYLVLGAQGSGATLGLRAHPAEGIAPERAGIVGGGAWGSCAFVMAAKTGG